MQAFLSLGRWVFPVPFVIFGLTYLMNVPGAAERIVPAYMPMKELWVYVSCALLLAAAACMYLGKYDKLAALLLAVLLMLVIVLVHLPVAMAGGEKGYHALRDLFQDIGLMAAALMYAERFARDGRGWPLTKN